MKLRTSRLHVMGASLPFIVDRKLMPDLINHNWRFVKRNETALATVFKGYPRMTLHHYVCHLKGKKWTEIFFDNRDRYDCRFVNLRPYNRVEDGARRKRFKKSKLPKGVYPNKKKFQALITYRRKLYHIGLFNTAEKAAEAYQKEFKKLHQKP